MSYFIFEKKRQVKNHPNKVLFLDSNDNMKKKKKSQLKKFGNFIIQQSYKGQKFISMGLILILVIASVIALFNILSYFSYRNIKYYHTITVFNQKIGEPIENSNNYWTRVGEYIGYGYTFIVNSIGEPPDGMLRRYRFIYVGMNDCQSEQGTNDDSSQWRIVSINGTEIQPIKTLLRLWGNKYYRFSNLGDWLTSHDKNHWYLEILIRESDFVRHEWSFGLFIEVEDYFSQ